MQNRSSIFCYLFKKAFLTILFKVGEICVTSGSTGNGYFGLEGLSNSTFKVLPLIDTTLATPVGQTATMTSQSSAKEVELNCKPIGDEQYVRSGLLGFLGPGGLVFVCGSKDGLMTVTGRKHNADDIIATVLAVEPMRLKLESVLF